VPPLLEVRQLVRLAAYFGINDNQARVALSRMAARGEVVAQGDGTYALAGRLAQRAERLAVARSGATGPYDGTWHLVVVTAAGDPAAIRQRRRHALSVARLGELRDAVWVRPANLDVELDEATCRAVLAFTTVPRESAPALAAAAFDLTGWARRAAALLELLDATTLNGLSDLAVGFETSATVLRHLQRDPLLPAPLLPSAWPGRALRARFDAFDTAYRVLLRDAHRAALAT